LRLRAIRAKLRRVAGVMVAGIAVGVSVVDGIVGGWMRFVSGLRRVGIAVPRRMRMRVWISALPVARLSR